MRERERERERERGGGREGWERVALLYIVVFWLSCSCQCSVSLDKHYCAIYWSNSLVYLSLLMHCFPHMSMTRKCHNHTL